MIEFILNTLDGRWSDSSLLEFAGPLWKGLVLMAIAWGLVTCLRRLAASTRHLVWTTAMVGLILLPFLDGLLPAQPVPLLPALESEARASLDRSNGVPGSADRYRVGENLTLPRTTQHPKQAWVAPDLLTGSPVTPVTAEPEAEPALSSSTNSTIQWLVAIWSIGALLVIFPALGGFVAYRRLLTRARREAPLQLGVSIRELCNSLGLRREVDVLCTSATSMPMACGILRPTVFVPPAATGWSLEKQRTVLLHELAHVKRRDCLTQLIANFAVAVHWFNPLAWYAARRMVVERERACDDLVLRAGACAEDYADCLIDVARTQQSPMLTGTFAVTMARPSQLEGRLLAILDRRKRRAPMSKTGISVAATLASFLLVPLATLQLTTREALGLEFIDGVTIRIGSEMVEIDGESLVPAEQDESVQSMIDAAPPGSTLRLPAGHYVETLVIDKDLTLIGTGWQTTHIRGTSEDHTALHVRGPATVTLRDLRFSSPGSNEEGRLGANAVVSLDRAEVLMENCAVIEGSANGILIKDGSAAIIRHCFVSAVWAEGIYVEQGAKATISQTDVRNVYHYGIKIRGAGVTVEACRVSGTGWHGIRYDHVSPTIRGNLLFDNERFGIYYNGETKATITQNHFHHNSMAGIVAWGSGEDVIENNTFSHNLRGGLEILEESNPRVRRNIFFANGTGVSNGNSTEKSPFVNTPASLVFERNYFWKNQVDTRWVLPGELLSDAASDALFDEHENAVADPMFVNPEENDYRILARSPAMIMNVGAANPLSFESPWPVTPEEERFLEARSPKNVEKPKAPANSLQSMSQPWIDGAMQIDDPVLRAQSIEKIRAALASGDEAMRHAGLVAFLGSLEAIEDKASFRELILPNVSSTNGSIQRSAYYALFNSGPQPGDLDLILNEARKKSPGLFGSISHLIALYSGGQLKGESSRVLEELFATDDKQELNDLLGGIWGAELSVPLESRIIELAQSEDRSLRHNAIYFGLSTLSNKSQAVIEELFKAAQGRDQSDSGRALWGLSHGVPAEHASLVADFGIKLMGARTSSRTRKKCMTLIENYAGVEQLPSIEALVSNELLDDKTREGLVQVTERIRRQ